jgi:hypothetical protein
MPAYLAPANGNNLIMKKMPYIMEMLIALVILPLSGFVDDRGGSQQFTGSRQVQSATGKQVESDQSGEMIPNLVVGVLFDL